MLKKIARPALASYFIVDGAKAVTQPAEYKDSADAVLQHVRTLLPRKWARQVSDDPELVARVLGGIKVGAGSSLALGKFPRTAAGVLTLATIPSLIGRYAFWETQDDSEKAERRSGFLTNVALLGGLTITSLDTDGKPSLSWRAKQALPSSSQASSFVQDARDWVTDKSDQVQGYVEDNKGEWKSAAKNAVEEARGWVQDVLEDKDEWLDAAKNNAKTAKKGVVRAAAKAQEAADKAWGEAESSTGRAAEKASKRAEKLQKQAEEALAKAKKKIGDLA